MSDLAAATGLHKGSLYQTFGDKHALFVSALQLYFNETFDALKNSRNGEPDPYEALKISLDCSIDRFVKGKGCLAVNTVIELAAHDVEIDKILKQFRQRLDKQLARLVDEAKASKRISKHVQTREAVRMIGVFLNGLCTHMASGMSANKARGLLHEQLDLVLSPRKRVRRKQE